LRVRRREKVQLQLSGLILIPNLIPNPFNIFEQYLLTATMHGASRFRHWHRL
jgi:hypothetical protein